MTTPYPSPLLTSYLTHSTSAYHTSRLTSLAPSLLPTLTTWYAANRRQLPWRGDTMPPDGWDGRGTLDGVALSKPAPQKTISSFFAKSTPTPPTTQPTLPPPPAIPLTPYAVWISETMLQQTRVAAVIPYFLKWIDSFPTVADVASATPDQINSHWSGLGFYRRARYLHAGAQYIVATHDGAFPTALPALLKIPGVGPYTAGAIASICYKQPTGAVDGNVLRVLGRIAGVAANVKGKYLTHFGATLAATMYTSEVWPEELDPGAFNQGIMELGATYCATKGTGVDCNDPLTTFYLTTQLGRDVHEFLAAGGRKETLVEMAQKCSCEVCNEKGVNGVAVFLEDIFKADETLEARQIRSHQSLPLDNPKKGKRDEVQRVGVMRNSEGKMLFGKRGAGLLESQWEFPAFVSDVREAKDGGGVDKVFESERGAEYGRDGLDELLGDILAGGASGKGDRIVFNEDAPMVHVFTHVRHFVVVEIGDVAAGMDEIKWEGGEGAHTEYAWLGEDELEERGVTSAIKKVLKMVKGEGETGKRQATIGGGGGTKKSKP